MAMTVNENALKHLISSPQITSIGENALERAILDDSRGIVDADPEAYDLGYEGTGYAIAILDTGVPWKQPFKADRESLHGSTEPVAVLEPTPPGHRLVLPPAPLLLE